MDDALHAASCLSGLGPQGATVYSTIDPCDGTCAYVGRCGGHERYRIAIPGDVARIDGVRWEVPASWRPCYTVIRCPDNAD